MRSIRLLRNVVTNYFRFFLTGFLGFVLTPLMVRLLGDADYGLWVAVFSLTGYFGLFDQGLRPSLVRYVSRDHARGDVDGLSRTLSSALALYSLVGAVTVAATLVVSAGFPIWFRIDPHQLAAARATVLLAGLSLAIGFPFGVFGATLSGLQRYDVANWIGIVVSVARATAFVIVLRMGGGLVGLAWVSLAMNVVGHVASWIAARRLLPGVRLVRSGVTRERLRLIASYGGFAFIGALASSIAFQTDALVITAFLGAASVTPFALAASLVDTVRSLVYSATQVLSPTASELETLGEDAKLHEMMIVGAKYAVLLSWPVLIACLIFGHNLMVTWVDAAHADAASLLAILALPTMVSLPQSATSSVLFGISRHKGVVALSLLNALLMLTLSLTLVRVMGLTGVAVGNAIPLAAVGGIATMVYGCRVLKLPLRRYVPAALLRPGASTLAFALPALAVQWLWRPMGWPALLAACGGCWALFAIVAWFVALEPRERERWTRLIAGLLGRSATEVAHVERVAP